jgi:hypothetical protein
MEVGGMKITEDGPISIKALISLAAVFIMAALLASCTPEGAFKNEEDYDVVVTLYDKEADFASIRTYLMPDSVVHFEDPQNPGKEISHDYDDLILERVEYNLQAVGYRRENDPEGKDPDVYVLVSATSSQWQALNYSWAPRWGWWGYWPGSSPDWRFMSPYYARGGVYSFSTGTLLIDMADYRETEEGEDEMRGIWTAAMNGILTEESSGTPQKLVDFIDRAFDQSPYLGVED